MLYTTLVVFASTVAMVMTLSSDDVVVSVECPSSCRKEGPGKIIGVIGRDLTVTYTIKSTFTEIKVTIGGLNSVAFNTHGRLNTDNLRDQRYSAKILSGKSFSVTLVNLTKADHNLKFTYNYKDENSKEYWNTMYLKVFSEEDAGRVPTSSSTLIVLCVVLALVVFVVTTLIVLWKQGVLSSDTCTKTKKQKQNTRPEIKVSTLVQEDPDKNIYSTPVTKVDTVVTVEDGSDQVKYSELGPGGGRLEKAPNRSPRVRYAQVKLEDDEEADRDRKGSCSKNKNSR